MNPISIYTASGEADYGGVEETDDRYASLDTKLIIHKSYNPKLCDMQYVIPDISAPDMEGFTVELLHCCIQNFLNYRSNFIQCHRKIGLGARTLH